MKKFFRILICILGFAVLPCIVLLMNSVSIVLLKVDLTEYVPVWVNAIIYGTAALASGIFFIIASRKITDNFENFVKRVEDFTAKQNARTVVSAVVGIALGLFIAYLICTLFDKFESPLLNVVVSVLIYSVCGYLGLRITRRTLQKMWKSKETGAAGAKVLDTSAVIDGRIFDLCKTGIVEGRIVIPEFVLDELRHIADSPDALKRTKGRKGLDALHKIRSESKVPVEIVNTDYEEIGEVDVKLLKLAEELGGKVITNDFNLNKVAAVKGVPVINVNDISNAVKPVLTAGEELLIDVIREGKDHTQGVGYLDDGTMIVIENGRRFIGQQIAIVVTSVLQTSAGRMIFAKPKEE